MRAPRVCARLVVLAVNTLIAAVDNAASKIPGGITAVRDVCTAYFDLVFPEE